MRFGCMDRVDRPRRPGNANDSLFSGLSAQAVRKVRDPLLQKRVDHIAGDLGERFENESTQVESWMG